VRTRSIVVAVLAALTVAALPDAAEAARCSVKGKERKLGATYVTSLSAVRVSCRTAERVVRAFHRCRRRNGGAKGRCRSRVMGYRCSDKRLRSAPTQFDARATCRRGKRRVTHAYTQFT